MQSKDVLVSGHVKTRRMRTDCMQNTRLLAGASLVMAAVSVTGIRLGSDPNGTLFAFGVRPQAATTAQTAIDDPGPKVPDGFTPIFNGTDLTGWHVSRTNHHGTTPEYRVVHGLIVGTQNPRGKGGILLTDKKYNNFEVYMEVKPDWGCDSGLFLRSSEAGEAYQVTLDYLPGGGMGGIYGENLKGLQNAAEANLSQDERQARQRQRTEAWQKAWKREAWNSVRARIEGDVPHITVWINDQLVNDFTDTANHAANGAADGMIAIQMHYSDEKTKRWVDGGFWRWRVIAVKEIPGK
jgi:hypothetical protein